MKKILLFSFVMFAACTLGIAQTVVFSDNFDSYTPGSHLAQSNPAWTTWNNNPGSSEDGIIVSDQAASAPYSLYVANLTDQIYPFGNYTTGHYTVTFNMYVPTSGQGAYFNIQHVMLEQWAFECNFYNNGTGYLTVGDQNYNFTYPSNTWFPVDMDVDLDQDQISLTINNLVVNTWPFHYTANSTTGGYNQLAGIDLFAGSPVSNATGTYYVDDFVVTEVSAALVSQFVVTPDTLWATMAPNETTTLNLNLSNPGTDATDFRIVTTYDIPNPDTTSTDYEYLQYCGDIKTLIGFTGGGTYDLAVGFPSEQLQQHIGQYLREIHVVMPDEITDVKVRVYGMNRYSSTPAPGDVIYEQPFTPTFAQTGWTSVLLDNPILIDGSDLWIGVWVNQPDSVYPIYMDSLPANPNGAWYKLGNTWHCIFQNFEYNLAIGGFVDGTPITPWVNVTPATGSIAVGGSQTPAVTMNTNGMNLGETYSATLHCFSSAYDNPMQDVPLYLTVTNVSVNEYNEIEVSLYPNPTADRMQITADHILRVEVFNMTGQKMMDNKYNDSHVVLDASGLTAGTYMVTVTTDSGKTTKKVVVR